jgi:hypothetical protein
MKQKREPLSVTIRFRDLMAFWALLALLLCLDNIFLHPLPTWSGSPFFLAIASVFAITIMTPVLTFLNWLLLLVIAWWGKVVFDVILSRDKARRGGTNSSNRWTESQSAGDRIEPATEVDDIVPIKHGGAKRDPANLGIWMFGILASAIVGGIVGARYDEYCDTAPNAYTAFSALAGASTFACIRLWLGQRREMAGN